MKFFLFATRSRDGVENVLSPKNVLGLNNVFKECCLWRHKMPVRKGFGPAPASCMNAARALLKTRAE